jgi:hypothetical protein
MNDCDGLMMNDDCLVFSTNPKDFVLGMRDVRIVTAVTSRHRQMICFLFLRDLLFL